MEILVSIGLIIFFIFQVIDDYTTISEYMQDRL
jgi:hypothetical protein